MAAGDCESDKTEIVWQSSELKLHKNKSFTGDFSNCIFDIDIVMFAYSFL